MKSTVKKRILVFICVLTFGASLLSGCGSKISDPWLDKWQEVVVDRSAEIEKAKVYYHGSIWLSVTGPAPQTTYDAKQISDMLDALYAPVESFYMATESEETGKKDTSHNKIYEYWENRYQIDFYIRGEAESFTVTVVAPQEYSTPELSHPATVFYEIDEDSALQSEEPADFDALKNIVESILNNK